MASQVLSGSRNVSYTNNTGQNVRVVINFMSNVTSISWAGVSAASNMIAIGRNLATSYIRIDDSPNDVVQGFSPQGSSSGFALAVYPSFGLANNNNGLAKTTVRDDVYKSTIFRTIEPGKITEGSGALPTELMLAPGQTFSATCGPYNIVVIPEAG